MTDNPLEDHKFREYIQGIREAGNPTMDALFSDLYLHIWREAHRQAAGEHSAGELQATELVGEAYLRLQSMKGHEWQDQGHVLRVVARVIRHVLVDRARRRRAAKHGGGAEKITLVTLQGKPAPPIDDVLALDQAMDELGRGPGNMPREAQVMELYCFVGAGASEIAKLLEISERQVFRDYRHAKTWLYQRLSA